MTVATPPTERRADSDRRREPRYPLAGRIHWRQSSDGDSHAGWLSDASRSGVSFVTSGRAEVCVGEEIELDSEYPWLRRPCHVARIAPYDDCLSLIACRTAEAHDQPGPSFESLRRSPTSRR